MRGKIQPILLGILLISLFVSPSALLAKKPDITQQFMDFMANNVGNSFDIVSKTTILRFRLTLRVNSQITSPTSAVLTNATVTVANSDIKLFDPTPRTVSVTPLSRNIIEFNSVQLPTIVARVFLTTITTNKIQTVLHFKAAKVTIGTLTLNAKGGKIIFRQPTDIVDKKDGNAPPAFSTRSKLTTIWARVKTQ